jgi:uncharacterized membrane protein YecN with MAPEG domain
MNAMTAAEAAALWSGLLIVLFVVLSFRVTQGRRRHKVLHGDGGVAEMNMAVRIFGNAAEYAPLGVAALALLALVGASPLAIHAIGAALFVGRLLHPLGMKPTGGVTLGRAVGMSLTWLALLGAAVALIFEASAG